MPCLEPNPADITVLCDDADSPHYGMHSAYVLGTGWVTWENASEPVVIDGLRKNMTSKQAKEAVAAAVRTDAGKVGHAHPTTSHEAAAAVNVTGQKARLHGFLVAAGHDGLTCFEASKLMEMSPNQTATRMMELREAELAVRMESTRETTPGNFGHVHVASCYQALLTSG